MANKKLARVKPLGTFFMICNGVALRGERYADGWFWDCPTFPKIHVDHDGSDSTVAAVDAFMRLALQPLEKLKTAVLKAAAIVIE